MKIINNILLIVIGLFAAGIYSQTPVLYNGFPKVIDSLDFQYTSYSENFCPLITDLDKDGHKEIIIITAGATETPKLNVFKSDGSFFPGFPKQYSEYIASIASGDVDGDGFLDIAMRSRNSVIVIDKNGNNLPGFPAQFPGGSYIAVFLSLYDLDGDGKLEIFTTSYVPTNIGSITVFNFNGQIRNGWPISIYGTARRQPAIGDVDNDGFGEIFVSSFTVANPASNGRLTIYRHNGVIFSNNWPVLFDSNYINWSGSPSLFINRTHLDSSFVCISTYRAFENDFLNKLEKYNIEGESINKAYSYNVGGLGTMVMGDVNYDGKVEFVVADIWGNSLSLYNYDLQLLPGWPQYGNNEFDSQTLICRLSSSMNIISQINYANYNYGYGYLFAYNINGSPLQWSPIRPYSLITNMSVSDLNNDGSVEIIASGEQAQKAFLHIWTIPGIPFSLTDAPWPQYAHDRYRTNQFGFIPPDEPIGIHPISSEIPVKFYLGQNFPNPFNPSTKIRVHMKTSGMAELTVYDVLGRIIINVVNQQLSPGIYQFEWNAADFSSGVYFYRLNVSADRGEFFTETKRMVLIK